METRDGRVAGTFVGIESGGAQELWVIAVSGAMVPGWPPSVGSGGL